MLDDADLRPISCLRNLGVTLFLAQAGMAAGPKFVATVAETGFSMLALGMLATAALSCRFS